MFFLRNGLGDQRTSILFQWLAMLFSNNVKKMDLFDDLVVETEHIMRFDIGRFVLFQQGQLVSDMEQTVQDGLFLWIKRGLYCRRVAHDEFV